LADKQRVAAARRMHLEKSPKKSAFSQLNRRFSPVFFTFAFPLFCGQNRFYPVLARVFWGWPGAFFDPQIVLTVRRRFLKGVFK
jgi:hypothetical protein